MAPKKNTVDTRMAVLETQQQNDRDKQNEHEKVCSERYGEIFDSFQRVHKRLDGINRATLSTLVSWLVALLGLIAWLLINGAPWTRVVAG